MAATTRRRDEEGLAATTRRRDEEGLAATTRRRNEEGLAATTRRRNEETIEPRRASGAGYSRSPVAHARRSHTLAGRTRSPSDRRSLAVTWRGAVEVSSPTSEHSRAAFPHLINPSRRCVVAANSSGRRVVASLRPVPPGVASLRRCG
jgi:hypothetical protein